MDSNDLDLIKRLIPFDKRSEPELKQLSAKAKITKFQQGKMIFKRDDDDSDVYWLLSGAIDLLDEKFEAKHRKAGDDAANYPIDNNNPHRLTAITTEETRILKLDRDIIGLGSLADSTADVSDEVEPGVDWMSTLLSSPLFEFIPPTNIQSLFSKFEEVKYDAGDIVIRQGDTGDYFYVIQKGRVKIERSVGDKTSFQTELKAGDNFGQDALVSDVPRNATVTMISQGTMMRLSEDDFESLLMRPVFENVNMDEAQEMVQLGDPRTYILDVRSPKEVEADKIKGALNVPLFLLRRNLSKLKNEAVYVTACDGGKRSELAAYLLIENGFTAYILK